MPKSAGTSLPSLSVRIDVEPECRIGPGKIQLLETIQAAGIIAPRGGDDAGAASADSIEIGCQTSYRSSQKESKHGSLRS